MMREREDNIYSFVSGRGVNIILFCENAFIYLT